jgi:protein phosphatase
VEKSTKDFSPGTERPTGPRFQLRGLGRTDVGLQRTHNEDTFFVDDELGLYLVCDGMGGHASGAIASQMALETVVRAIQAAAPSRAAGEPVLPDALRAANTAIFVRGQSEEACRGMGTTAVGLLAEQSVVHVCHVGDSRIYLLRDRVLRQLTRDHSLENLYRDKPELEGQLGPAMSNVIVRAIGLEPFVEVDHIALPMQDGDVYLLCCDGLTDLVDDRAIQDIMVGGETLDIVAQDLIAAANQRGGADNITVVLVALFQRAERRKKTQPGF